MSMPFEQLTEKVNAFIRSALSDLKTSAGAQRNASIDAVVRSLHLLVEEFGTDDYGFNLAMEQYVRLCRDLIMPHLRQILEYKSETTDLFPTDTADMKVAFAAYYALSLIAKKENDLDLLAELADEDRYPFPPLYPLAYEVHARYYKRMGDYKQALQADSWALSALGMRNIGVGISYASTVCMMYEAGWDVRADQYALAVDYVNAALEYNPNYSKYYYLRGKLSYYASLNLKELDPFKAKCEEAIEWVTKAQQLEFRQPGNYRRTALNEYQLLIDRIREELTLRIAGTPPFQPMSAEEVSQRIEQIKAATDERTCRPPNPKLQEGQKFFFVSYAHSDFKAVYCDLVRLYALKVPYQYDGDLCAGENWVDKVYKYLTNVNCLGVIFYISRQTPLSEPVETECRLLKETGKAYFSVNLEGGMAPYEILFACIRANDHSTLLAKRVDSKRMIHYLESFDEQVIYVRKMPGEGPASADHMDELITAISRTFEELQSNAGAGV